ncbi:hypothetical protein KSP40_PGU014210 [Platanthera guangdongensis]|uniref:Uncharacterized protein n=1 Tax=Platanthera guangdongensis TaxID=2320717 RepID=A0ABR2MI12_9ASPA
MPFPTKVQPADWKAVSVRNDQVKAAGGGGKSRLKRLFERQFQSVLRISSSEKIAQTGDESGGGGDQDQNSVCLVFSFMEENNEKSARCGRRRCNCFNGNCDDSSDDEFDGDAPPITTGSGDSIEILKNLVLCASITERNLLADASKIIEKSKVLKAKVDFQKITAAGLRDLGYDASVCKSRWEKSPSVPAGEYEYVDVILDGERYLLDVDFRSEFEIARSTKKYRAVLQLLPAIFVGKESRLQQIVTFVSEASKQSLKKKGLHFPPWRKAEYMRAKWLSPYDRNPSTAVDQPPSLAPADAGGDKSPSAVDITNFSGEFQIDSNAGDEKEAEKTPMIASSWKLPAVKPKAAAPVVGSKTIAGLASVLRETPPSPVF